MDHQGNVTQELPDLGLVNLSLSDATTLYIQPIDPISKGMLTLLYKIFNACVVAICFTGVCTNAVTLRTFYRISLEDSMTISFFFLAVCDFGNCLVVSMAVLCDVCNILANEGLIVVEMPPYIPFFYVSSVRIVFSITAAVIKVYMAVQRCLCVTLPFRVRGLFTRNCTLILLLSCLGITSMWTLVYICGHSVQTLTIPAYNITYPIVERLAEIETFVNYQEFIIAVIFSTCFQIISISCFIIMIVALKKSAKFRKSATAVVSEVSDSQAGTACDKTDLAEKSNSKEKQVLIQVAFLTGIFCLTSTPLVGQGLATVIVPGYTYNQVYHNLYMTIHGCPLVLEMLNAAGNFFVYRKYNSKFRSYLSLKINDKV